MRISIALDRVIVAVDGPRADRVERVEALEHVAENGVLAVVARASAARQMKNWLPFETREGLILSGRRAAATAPLVCLRRISGRKV